MRILIDGADGSGKTTLAKKLADKYNLSYIDLRGKDPMTFEFNYNLLDKTNVVFDRSFLSDRLYSKFYGLPPRLTKGQERTLVQKCLDQDIEIILCIPEEHKVLPSEDTDIKLRHGELIQGYKELASEYNLKVIDPFKEEV